MSRQSQQRTMQQSKPPKQHLTEQEAIAASELFDLFCVATTMRQILGLHRDMCDILGLRPAPINEFYPMLKAKIRSWKAQALWKKFDARAAHRVYAKGTACNGTRVLVIGAGPCGMRSAIEAQLLGAKVVVLEKRDRITRNNVLHLWPFVITDLRNLGAKKFYGKFCAGSIDHISIRQLQIILMKVALLLGVEIHENVSFERTIEPSGDGFGWRAAVTPTDHVVSYYEFDVLIGADGKRNTLEGFKRKEFRGKLAIAITANFINKKTEAEAKAEEISGVAFIFNQSFFKELYERTGIDLENIVYYKDETHYFVMTAKKHSLIDKGVILQDFSDPAELLAPANVSADKLLDYAREAAEFSTKYQMPNLEFAVNHYGKPDVAMFDFTSMFASETSCRVIVRNGFRLLQCLVGDSLLEPFWPTGSGCARGFLSSMDAAYAVKLWSNARNNILAVVAQRESIYRLLNQTTPENLQRDTGSYTVDPASRYPNLNRSVVSPFQVRTLVDSDDPKVFEQPIADIITTPGDTPAALRKPRRSTDVVPDALLHWVRTQLHMYDFIKDVQEPADILKNGKSLCALISRFRPDLIDYTATRDLKSAERNEIAFRILESEYQLPRIMTGEKSIDLEKVEARVWLHYLSQVRELFRGEVPYLKHPKMDVTELREKYRLNNAHAQPDFSKLLQLSTKPKYPKAKSPIEDMVDVPQVVHRRSVMEEERVKRMRRHEPTAASPTIGGNAAQQAQSDTPRRAKKRRSAEKTANIEERQTRLQEIEENRQERLSKRRQQRYQQTQNFYKSLQMLQANTLLREGDDPTAFEDYSLFIYRQHAPEFNDRVKELERKLLYPDRNRGDIPSAMSRNNTDDQFSDRIKSMEQRISSRNTTGTDKKPKDLMRAIGKIDSSDWNVREIEKKIEQSKRTETHGPKGREKVPKWSKEQFLARQNKMAKPTRQESVEEKFKEIDQTLKNLDKQLKEGSIREVGERGRNKVASIAGQFAKKDDKSNDEKTPNPTIGNVVPKSSAKVALAFKKQAASEKCHFCKQIVYLMEKITAEDLVFHRSCLKCHHCHTNLRLGGYAFDRDDPNGRFYCTQHFRLPAKAIRPVMRKPGQRKPTQLQQATAAAAAADNAATRGGAIGAVTSSNDQILKTPDKLRGPADTVVQLDLLDRGQTPERIEFENTDAMSDGEPSEEHILDEHEWSGRNFLPESNQDSESDLSSSDDSDNESDADMFEEANDSPLAAQTLQLASDWIGKQHYSESDDSDEFYDTSDENADDDGKDDTEGEDFKKARELRREEVRLLPLPTNLPTDTETEIKQINENNEKEDVDMSLVMETGGKSTSDKQNLKPESDKGSEKSFKSAVSSPADEVMPLTVKTSYLSSPPTKADIEKLEQTTGRRFSAEIEAINEKLHRLNNVVKMNKDIETIAKENLVKSDILKKLTMKEKWLADNSISSAPPQEITPKSTFENRFAQNKQDVLKEQQNNAVNEIKKAETVLDNLKAELNSKRKNYGNNAETKSRSSKTPQSPEEILESLKAEIKNSNLNRTDSLKKQKLSPTETPSGSTNAVKTKDQPKSGDVSRANSLKRSDKFTSKDGAIAGDSKMHLQNILGLVKSVDGKQKAELNSKKSIDANKSNSDIGKLLYDAENKFSPKGDRRLMQEKLKEIEAKSFSGTMDAIKSQMVVPTVSSQTNLSVDLSKYFPDQKLQNSNSTAVNKNQKNLKDVDLAKYFPTSPSPQRRSAVVTVADKLKKSQTEKAISPAAKSAANNGMNSNAPTPKAKGQASAGNAAFSLRDHQLDGAVDLSKKSTPGVAVATSAKATVTKKGNVKIIKKIVPKKKTGTVKQKSNNNGAQEKISTSIVPRDDSDRVLDEILQSTDKEMHSPSAEYLKLFKEEKSPSEDLSDKVEQMYRETGIDLGLPERNKKRLLKTKSLGEGDFEGYSKQFNLDSIGQLTKEEGDRPRGVQGLLARYESMNSVKSSEQSFKLRRMESTTSNFNKSRESLISRDSIISRDSETISDLEKTMEYLKSEWQNEATNFLQKKRDNFYAKKRAIEEEEEIAAKDEAIKKNRYEDLPVQYRESKIAKFFGIKSRSPEKTKTALKMKSPEKKLFTAPAAKTNANNCKAKKSPSSVKDVKAFNEIKPMSNVKPTQPRDTKCKSPSPSKKDNKSQNSLKISAEKITRTQNKSISPPKNQMENFEMDLLVEKGSIASSAADKLSGNSVEACIEGHVDSETKMEHQSTESSDINIDNLTTPKTVSRRNSSNSDLQASESPTLRRHPMLEDIKNLPKTGCDKSLNNSRRNSQTSLNVSRRCSDASQQPDDITSANLSLSTEANSKNVDEPVENIVDSFEVDRRSEQNFAPEECDSLCTSISKSPSVAPTTARPRGSSEDESIEKLFSNFSDEMLVNVEFDSNDELVAITPCMSVAKKTDGENDLVDRPESLEKDVDSNNTLDTCNKNENSVSLEIQTMDGSKESPERDTHKKPASDSVTARTGPLTLERIQSMLYMDPPETPFPIRPQRRQKSTSSSSDASAPIAPQRMKHKLAKLQPADMPPSVQDLMQTVLTKSLADEFKANDNAKLHKFPRNISEDELEDVKSNGRMQYDRRENSPTAKRVNCDRKENRSNTDYRRTSPISANLIMEQMNDLDLDTVKPAGRIYDVPPGSLSTDPVKANSPLNGKISPQASILSASSKMPLSAEVTLAAARRNAPQVLLNDVAVSPSDSSTAQRKPSLNSMDEKTVSDEAIFNSASMRSEKLQASADALFLNSCEGGAKNPNESPNLTDDVKAPNKASSKERSLDWDITKMRASPMPRRKFVHAERQGVQDPRIRDVSPTSSIKILNNLSSHSSDTDEHRIIEDFEMKRRQALLQRDKNYQELEKQKEKTYAENEKKSNTSSSNSSKRSTPLTTSRFSSRRGTQDSISTQRDITPPNFKRLVVPPDENDLRSVSSRCSSFALIELMSNGEARIAPMPQKLKIPAPKPQPVKVPMDNEANREVFQNRPWPGRGNLSPEMNTSESPDTVIEVKRTNSEPKSPVPEVFRNRKWPDGKTVFGNADDGNSDNDKQDDTEYFREIPKQKNFRKLHSHSPQPSRRRLQLADDISVGKSTSKSITDLHRESPSTSIYNSEASLNRAARSSRSSGENSAATETPKRPMRHMATSASCQAPVSIDASTRILLDRGKHLHQRKNDFVNELAAERNPYLRDINKAERRINYDTAAELSDDDELDCYRPSGYSTKPLTRFPTSRALGRDYSTTTDSHFNYTPIYGIDYGLSNSRRPYTTLDYNPYLSRGSGIASGLGSSLIGRSSNPYFTDYARRSPSRHREREHSKESCVQSDSDSASPKKVELNSATEISTDSEFDHDELACETPKIFIDDTHLRKPTKVQVKSTVLTSTAGQRHHISSTNNAQNTKGGSYLQKYQANPLQPQFKPLVQVDPTLLTKTRLPLQNPRPGDYLLNKTASTEGIASKKSLELKKRYLLGEQGNGNKIQKSGSTSVLDSRIRSFQSNISECQKLLNPGSGISPSMKTFLDRTKLGESIKSNDLLRSATTNILNDLKIEITVQKASSTASTDNEKENVFVNSKNELNKGMEYSETVNTTLLESVHKKSPTSLTNNQTIIETIDLVTPEREKSFSIIDLTKDDTPTRKSNNDFSKNDELKLSSSENNDALLLNADSNKMEELTCESPVKSDKTIIEEIKPDVSKDVKECIPDILGHIGQEVIPERRGLHTHQSEDQEKLLSSRSCDDEKMDSPEKLEEQFENETLQIQVPNIPWGTRKIDTMSSTTTTTGSSCTSNSSSIEDIQHYILESTTSPDTQTGNNVIGHQVPRVEIHDTSGTLMQIDSLMIIDGKYIGDPEDLKYMELPKGVVVPESPIVKTSEIEDENETYMEAVTATPEPIECTVIEANAETVATEDDETEQTETEEHISSLSERDLYMTENGVTAIKANNFKFDTKNENKVESLKNLPLIVEQIVEPLKVVKPITLNLSSAQKSPNTPTTPTIALNRTPTSPFVDSDITPTGDLVSRGSDSETELTGTGQAMTETELSDWTADDCISENFVDMEFAFNTNQDTMKCSRNERKKRRSAASKLPTTIEMLGEINKTAPVAEFEGILKSIDIDDIEFMDTGSEGSCAEAYSATNTALLRNRGYMEFIDMTPRKNPVTHNITPSISSDNEHKLVASKRHDGKMGVDYIEQGAYILQKGHHEHDTTPVNEDPQMIASLSEKSQVTTGPPSVMTQSLTDSSTLNDLEDDSLFTTTTTKSRIQQSTATTDAKTTTEESEALTVVTSPLDSSSAKAGSNSFVVGRHTALTGVSSPSSSDKNPKTSQSASTTAASPATPSSKLTPPHCLSQEDLVQPSKENSDILTTAPKAAPRKPSNELSYEECVRALQHKITQISTGRDSDVRKQRRKSSKGEMPADNNVQTVIESKPSILQLIETEIPFAKPPSTTSVTLNASPSAHVAQIEKVPEIPTLTSKLEEITKERTKQKDLIHYLVMDKLQSKKQLNAEKRLHRSRQRTILTSGYASGSSLSPTPKIAAATTTTDTNCTSRAHYHESTAATAMRPSVAPTQTATEQRSGAPKGYKEDIPLQKSSTYISTYGLMRDVPKRPIAYQQRPFSEHLNAEQLNAFDQYKLTKSPSFSYELPATQKKAQDDRINNFSTPLQAQERHNKTQTAKNIESSLTTSTENLRSEARARARLKSNTDLGLSPEEKMQILRQRLHLEHHSGEIKSNPKTPKHTQYTSKETKDMEDILVRDRRLSASKSVNDLVYIASKQSELSSDNSTNIKSTGVTTDFTSDPNLLLSSTSIQSSTGSVDNRGAAKVMKSSRRQKDPERRKSLIKSLSSFFHKEKKDVGGCDGGSSTSAHGSATTERPGTSGNSGTPASASGGIDMGVFSRFRISPKTKEKSKESQLYNNANIHLNTTPTKSSNKKSSTAAALSSSSPQLFIHRPSYMASHDTDESTPPPIPPLPLNYQRSDDESNATETREQKRQRAISKAVRQAELKRLRIAQEIQREQEEIEVQLRELESRGVLIEKALRGEEEHHASNHETYTNIGSNDEKLLKELLEIWRNITQLKKRDEELSIRQQELQLEHRHAQLKEELNLRLSCNKLDKSSADVAAEGAILNEMLEIVAKRAALRPAANNDESNI